MKAAGIKIDRIRNGFFSPVLGPVMQERRITILLALVTVVQVAITAAGIVAWQCPVKSALGIACPACGMTRAIVLFAQGHWKSAMDLHAFGPIFSGIGIFLVAGSILPAGFRKKIAHEIAAFERSTGMVGLLMLSFLAYWLLRITNVIQ